MTRPTYPFDDVFYLDLFRRRTSFKVSATYHVPAGRGYGLRVEAGQLFRFVMTDGAQIIDLCLFNADDPHEHFASGAQFNIEGTYVTRFTRIWGTPPQSRPLATVISDSVSWRDNAESLRDHKSYGGHCNPHHWMLFAGVHPHTCYDNLRSGLAMVGLSQRHIHDNLNLFQKMAMDPFSGQHLQAKSDAEPGDYLEFYAEIPLFVVLSLCPYGDGSVAPAQFGEGGGPVVRPIAIDVVDTDVLPLGWQPPNRTTAVGDRQEPSEHASAIAGTDLKT